jgi:hypothetical protein
MAFCCCAPRFAGWTAELALENENALELVFQSQCIEEFYGSLAKLDGPGPI